ncbi:hypothetical protein JL720_16950 [Aureococcus anophagefferens]|nr:hypothetical protein JL720_16950 [Aureococcus anophagefferens]
MSNTATHGMTDEGLRRRRTLPEPKLRDADIARRMFLVGSCLLPVIWLVCVARFWRARGAAPSGAEAEAADLGPPVRRRPRVRRRHFHGVDDHLPDQVRGLGPGFLLVT